MLPGLTYLASLVRDPLVKAIAVGGVAALCWLAFEIRSTRSEFVAELEAARQDLQTHTAGMYARMDPMVKVSSELAAPANGTIGKMVLFDYLDGYKVLRDDVASIKRTVGEVEKKVDRVLEAVAKGRK